MRKVLSFAALSFFLAVLFAGCMNPSVDGGGGGGGKSVKICLIGADTSKTWNVWAWKENGNSDINYSSKSWPGGDIQLTGTDSADGYIYTTMDVDTSYPLGILFVDTTQSAQTSDVTVPAAVLSQTGTLFFIYGGDRYYTSFGDAAGIKSAEIRRPTVIRSRP